MAGPVQGSAPGFVQAIHTNSVVQTLPQPAQVAWKSFTEKHKKEGFSVLFCFEINSVLYTFPSRMD